MRIVRYAGGEKYNDDFEEWEDDYEVLNPKHLLTDMFIYKEEPIEWDLKRIILVGAQNSGKTNFIRYIVRLLRMIYGDDVFAFQTNDIRILNEEEHRHIFEHPVLCVIIDDAIRYGMESRRSMSVANVDITQNYFRIRHTLDTYRKNGVCIVIFAVQDFTAIDKRIRNNVQLTIYKNYYKQSWFEKELQLDDDILGFIRKATYGGLIKSDFEQRGASVGVVQTGDIFGMSVEFIPSREVQYDLFLRQDPKLEIKRELILDILEKYEEVSTTSPKKLKGYLSYRLDDYEEVVFTSSDYTDIINRACFLQGEDIDSIVNKNITHTNKVFNALRQEKIANMDRLVEITNISKELIWDVFAHGKDKFVNVMRGVWTLKGYHYTEDELIKFKPPEMKKLIMEDEKNVSSV